MPNKHFCQGPDCHTRTTQDDKDKESYCERAKYFCSTNCESLWLDEHMQHIEQGRPIEFIRHRRETGGYQKVIRDNNWGSSYYIERIDNRTETD